MSIEYNTVVDELKSLNLFSQHTIGNHSLAERYLIHFPWLAIYYCEIYKKGIDVTYHDWWRSNLTSLADPDARFGFDRFDDMSTRNYYRGKTVRVY